MSMLRSLRERKGLSVGQLAAKAGVSSRIILDYEEGRQAITLPHAKLLAKALWVGIEELMPPAGTIIPPSTPPAQSAPLGTAPHHDASQAPTHAQAAPAAQPSYQQPYHQPQQLQQPHPQQSYQPQAQPYGAPSGSQRGYQQGGGPGGMGGPGGGGAGRAVRSVGPEQGGRGGSSGGARPVRQRPAPPPPSPITGGQLDELQRLAVKLDITNEQLEERIGKKLSEMTRPEAKDWIKRARGMAEEIAPTRRVSYGQWPEGREDQEAAYLKSQQDAGAHFTFKLFSGEEFAGTIADFTPYTITVRPHEGGDQGEEVVLRKLAIAYYRRMASSPTPASMSTSAETEAAASDAASGSEPPAEPEPMAVEPEPIEEPVEEPVAEGQEA